MVRIFFCALCVHNFLYVYVFLCQKKYVCKNCSVQASLWQRLCKNAYVPFFYVSKSIFVQSIGMY